jgi:hypothetical protein
MFQSQRNGNRSDTGFVWILQHIVFILVFSSGYWLFNSGTVGEDKLFGCIVSSCVLWPTPNDAYILQLFAVTLSESFNEFAEE